MLTLRGVFTWRLYEIFEVNSLVNLLTYLSTSTSIFRIPKIGFRSDTKEI